MEYEKLCHAIEQQLNREMHTPADFDYLSEQLLKKTGSSVSSTTLMRIWGYRPSVTVRVSTLDILARFIGYEDYTHFKSASEADAGDDLPQAEPTHDTEEETGHQSTHHRLAWWLAALAAIAVLAACLWAYRSGWHRRESDLPADTALVQGHFITQMSQLSNDRKYLIHTRQDRRGVLGTCGRHLASTYGIALFYRCEEPSPFALIRHDGAYFLFSVQEDRFVNALLYLTNEPLRRDFGDQNWCAFNLRPERGCFVLDFKAGEHVYTLNVNAGEGMIMDIYGTQTGAFDDGNLFMLEDIGSFDPTEAFALLQSTQTAGV